MNQKLPPESRSENQEQEIPGIKFSKKLSVRLFLYSFILAFGLIFGYLFYREYIKTGMQEPAFQATKLQSQDRLYTNNYWGFKFRYPSFWYPVVGSYEEGDYFFASEPINFISELENDQALMEVKTFRNLKGLSFDDWVDWQEENYFPLHSSGGKNQLTVGNLPARRILMVLKKPEHGTSYWDVVIVGGGNQRVYQFVLETRDQETLKKFQAIFETMVNSLEVGGEFGT